MPTLSRQLRGLMWSVEKEPQTYKSVDEIIDDAKIQQFLDTTKEQAKDISRVKSILQAAKDRSFLTHREPGGCHWVPGAPAAKVMHAGASRRGGAERALDL